MNSTARAPVSSLCVPHGLRLDPPPVDPSASLTELSGEDLLLLAISGRPADRRRIHQELECRALFAKHTRRARNAMSRPALRLVHGHAA